MVRELQKLIPAFAGEASLTRCFLHVVNLVAKTTIRVFDVPRKDKDSNDDDAATGDAVLDQARQELEKLAQNVELEDAETRVAMAQQESESDGDEDSAGDVENSTEGWVDERELMEEDDKAALDESVLPVRLAILKVRVASSFLNICLIFILTAPSSIVRYPSLDHHPLAPMVRHPRRPEARTQSHATRRRHPLELDLRHVEVRRRVPDCHRDHGQGEGPPLL